MLIRKKLHVPWIFCAKCKRTEDLAYEIALIFNLFRLKPWG